jgi:protein-disulfide isomerase
MNVSMRFAGLVIILLLAGTGHAWSAAPSIDKAAVANYLRYAEAFTPQVQLTVDDPEPSSIPGFFKLTVHLRMNKNEATRNYFISANGQQIISGSVYDLHQSPFATNLAQLKVNGAPATGSPKAPVQIYIFSDFQCPYCREEAKVLRQSVEKKHSGDVYIVFKHFPLDAIHPWARPAAIASQCIAAQKPEAFWAFHDWIYEHQQEIKPENLSEKTAEFAKTQGIETDKLKACEADPSTAAQVEKTVAEGRALGVASTPTLFVNGRMLGGTMDERQMDMLIQVELERQKQHSAMLEGAAGAVSTVIARGR